MDKVLNRAERAAGKHISRYATVPISKKNLTVIFCGTYYISAIYSTYKYISYMGACTKICRTYIVYVMLYIYIYGILKQHSEYCRFDWFLCPILSKMLRKISMLLKLLRLSQAYFQYSIHKGIYYYICIVISNYMSANIFNLKHIIYIIKLYKETWNTPHRPDKKT